MFSSSVTSRIHILARDSCVLRSKRPGNLHWHPEVRRSHQSHKRQSFPISTIYFAKDLLMSEGGEKGDGPDFNYTHLWTSKDGETHIQECRMTGFDLKKYAQAEQYIKDGGEPAKTVFTEMAKGMEQDLHSCPQVQLVVTLQGSWYIQTTDGSKKVFTPGQVLFQDNTKDSPAAKQPQHRSGVVGDEPCQQFIVQLSRKPEVDKPGSPL